QRKYIARIRHNQQHLLRLVDELLDLAKIESGQFPLKLGSISIHEVIESLRDIIEPLVRTKDLQLEVSCTQSAVMFVGDKDRVEQILLNLLANAVKFTPSGGTITIVVSENDERVVVAVCDTGRGIPEDKLALVFEPFVQLQTELPGAARGTGLGLAISRELARAMGGELIVTSVPGAGSTFALSLPRSISVAP
ncbi:MAG TPA: HAMP domain-containing sensor histidine kinase, partial [Gemmatimonadaceae bacterium]|nr:HAMP domain-containing sensor histidine kinase [Gemmatimonadaceae bacterium]